MKEKNYPMNMLLGGAVAIAFTAPYTLLANGYDDPRTVSTVVASTCTVDEASAGKHYKASAGLYSSNGSVVARCPIANPMDTGNPLWNAMRMTYRDPDGSGSQYQVKVRLKRVDSLGFSATVATTDSNLASSPSTGTDWMEIEPAHSFNFLSYSYYLEVTVTRPAGPFLVIGPHSPASALFAVWLIHIEQVPG